MKGGLDLGGEGRGVLGARMGFRLEEGGGLPTLVALSS